VPGRADSGSGAARQGGARACSPPFQGGERTADYAAMS